MASALCEEIKTDAARGDSEQYDLAGFTQGWLQDLVTGCLGEGRHSQGFRFGCQIGYKRTILACHQLDVF
jgi:hypothetical protein